MSDAFFIQVDIDRDGNTDFDREESPLDSLVGILLCINYLLHCLIDCPKMSYCKYEVHRGLAKV